MAPSETAIAPRASVGRSKLLEIFLIDINKAGTTIILTTHYLEEAENLCRNIAIIDNGTIIENTKMEHLLKKLETPCWSINLKFTRCFEFSRELSSNSDEENVGNGPSRSAAPGPEAVSLATADSLVTMQVLVRVS